MKDYKKILEGVVNIINTTEKSDIGFVNICTYIGENCPELKKSEDERIRKWIVGVLSTYEHDRDLRNAAIAWLEKQGTSYTKNDVDDAYLEGITVTKNEIEKQYKATYQIRKDIATFIFNYRGHIKDRAKWMDYLGIKVSFGEEQGEQKPADKVEPKFKVGNWYQCTKDFFGKGVRFDKGNAYYCGQDGCLQEFDSGAHIAIVEELYEYFRLWTIQDAKDGDVLSIAWHEGNNSWEKIIIFKKYHNKGVKGLYNMSCVEGYGNTFKNGKLVLHEEVPYHSKTWTDNLQPATKEQRDTLEKAMRGAGWEFDFEKKELKKIEQNSYGGELGPVLQ